MDKRGTQMGGRGKKTWLGLALAAAALLALAAPAQAKEARLPQAPVGTFTEPRGLAVDQETHDVYVIDGRSEVQSIKVSATAGKFRLKFEGKEEELNFNANSEKVRDALRKIVCGGATCLITGGGSGNENGTNPYVVSFVGPLDTTDEPQIECESGTTPLSGGAPSSGCTVTTTTNGVNGTIARYHADGTPAAFAALGSNQIDGRSGADKVEPPPEGLRFGPANEVQVVVDESGGITDGDIYMTQSTNHLVDVFAQSGAYLGQLTQYEETPGNAGTLKALGEPCGVGADDSGNFFVGDYAAADLVHKYAPSANPAKSTDNKDNFNSLLGPSSPCTLAAGGGTGEEATGGFLFADRFNGELFKLDTTTGELKYGGKAITSGATTVTVDQTSGRLFSAAGSEVREFDAAGSAEAVALGTIKAPGQVRGVAVDGTTGKGGTVYLDRSGSTQVEPYGPLVTVPDVSTEAANGIAPGSATLNGTISADNGPSASCHFQYATEAAYLADRAIAGHDGFSGASSAACEPAGPFTGSTPHAVSAKAEPLSHETAYRFRIVGENANTTAPADDPGEALGFETFGKPKVNGGTATEVTTTSALIKGEVNPGGQQTSFAVEYVSQAEFQKSGYNKAASAPQPAAGIGSGAAFAPVSQELTELTPDTAYRFRLTATNADGTVRGKEGAFATFAPATGLPDERAYELVSPPLKLGEVFPADPGGAEPGRGGTCIACTPGWAKNRMPMQPTPDGQAITYEGNPFAAGLAAGSNEYLARRGATGWQTAYLSKPNYPDTFGQGFKAFSEDLSRGVLYQVEPSLGPEAPLNFANLYLSEEGAEPRPLISAAFEPHQRLAGTGNLDSFRITYAGANSGTEGSPPFSHVVFEANDALTPAEPGIAPAAPAVAAIEDDLYEYSGGELHLVNVLPGNAAAIPNAVIGSGQLLEPAGVPGLDFSHAISADGSRVFWSALPSGQAYVREGGAKTIEVPDPGKFLTASADGAEVLLSDGKVYDLEDEALSDLTAGKGGFQGMAGASEDLRRIYFVDTKALTAPAEVNGNEEHAEEGKPNLYLWEEGAAPDEGTTTFIARLAGADNENVGFAGPWHAAPDNRTAQASADGRYLAFQSTASLSGYDSGGRFEVFEYDAASGALACASCNPAGQAPLGPSNLTLLNGGLINAEAFSPPRNLTVKGRLFFESQDALSPEDKNGYIQDLYEWEPGGVGSCGREGGCTALISSGQSPKDSFFVNATPSGDDAFFTTRSQLLPTDEDDFMDLYDARVGGGVEAAQAPVCEAEACRGASTAAPGEPGAASATFAGPPNEKPRSCAARQVLRRGRCVKRPHRHRRHAKRAGHERGGTR